MTTDTAVALVRSETRLDILRRLRAGDASKYDLRAELDCARTTVDRNVEQLVEDGWVDRTEGEYALTSAGVAALDAASEYVETVSAAERLQPLLDWLPESALDIDLCHLADAEVTVASEATPVAMVDKHVMSVKRADHTRVVLPVVSTQGMDAQAQAMAERDVHAEIIVPPTVADVFVSNPAFEELIATLRERGTVELLVTDRPVPYYLGVLDETVQIGVDDGGQPKALLESEAGRVREWAAEKFASYKQSATPLPEWRE